MITLSESHLAGPELHAVPSDPGALWLKGPQWVIDAAPYGDIEPLPEAKEP